MNWSHSPQAFLALFLIALAESSFFPIPPDVLLIAIVAARPTVWFAAAATGYGIGFGLMATVGDPIIAFYGAQSHWDQFLWLANTWGIWFLAAAAFTPIPFKVATIAAGAIEMPFVPFLVIGLLGRASRFFLVGAILRLFGRPVRSLLEKHFNLATILFLTLLVGGFLILRFL